MKDWAGRLDDFLHVNRLNILETAGKITAQQAKELVESEYEKFIDRRRLEQDRLQSDFDKMVKQIEDKTRKAKKSVADID
jgi:hypothetical protein